MTVLGPLPDHVARALRGEPQVPPNAQHEERAAGSSACLPPDVRAGANPPYTSVGGREMRGLLAGLANREKIERVIREQTGTIAFDLAGLDAIAKEKQWTLAIDPAISPPQYAYAQHRIETNYATLNGGHVITHPADEDRWTVSSARDVIDEELRKVGAELFILYRHASGHEAVVEGGTNADVAEALRRAITRSHVALTLIGTTLVGDTNTDAIEFSRPGKSLGCRDPSASLSFGGGSGLLTPEMKDALEQRGRTISQGPNHQQLPPRVSLTGTKTPNIRTFMHELSDDERASIGKQIADALNEGLEPTRVTVAGGSTLDALGFTKQVTHSRCPDCNGTGVLAGFGFGTSANAVDRPCHGSPPKDEGPSEWTVVESRPEFRSPSSLTSYVTRVDLRKLSERLTVFVTRLSHRDERWMEVENERGSTLLFVRGEHCVDMAIARLLCGLRDGSIAP